MRYSQRFATAGEKADNRNIPSGESFSPRDDSLRSALRKKEA